MTSTTSEKMIRIFQSRNCPICGSSTKSPFIESEFNLDKTSEQLGYFKDLWYGLDTSSHFLEYYQCRDCNAIYCPKYFTEESLGELYKFMPPNMEVIAEHLVKKTQARYAEFLAKSMSQWLGAKKDKSLRILEMGSDTGIFLIELVSILKQKYEIDAKNITIFSVEPNIGVHPVLTKNIEDLGVDFQLFDSFEQYLDQCDSAIDIIVGIHVFDHILTPQQVLQKIAQRGNEEFYLYGVVHNVQSILARVMGRRWPPFCLQHPQLYSKNTLPRLFSESFTVKNLSISPTFNDYPIAVIANFLGLRFLNELLGSLYLKIPLGNIQFVCKGTPSQAQQHKYSGKIIYT